MINQLTNYITMKKLAILLLSLFLAFKHKHKAGGIQKKLKETETLLQKLEKSVLLTK